MTMTIMENRHPCLLFTSLGVGELSGVSRYPICLIFTPSQLPTNSSPHLNHSGLPVLQP